jgi:hypothetical protein
MIRSAIGVALACAGLALADPAHAAELVKCRLSYDLEGWSFIYKHARGTGHITCANGAASQVRIVAHGGGATIGTQSSTAPTPRPTRTPVPAPRSTRAYS